MPRALHVVRMLIAAATLTVAGPAAAQSPPPSPPVTVPPVSLILPNYNTVPVGEVAALEGGAFVARANNTAAGYYNPAGLADVEQTSISGSAGAYQFGSVSPDVLTNVKGSVQHIPAMFGVVIDNLMGRPEWAGGFTFSRPAAWSQAVDSQAVSSAGGQTNRLRFSTDATYDAWLASLGVGYAFSDRLRVGATIDGQYTSVSRRQSVSDQLISSSGLSAIAVSSLGNLSTTHLRATLGGQFKVSPTLQLGAMLRTPGLGVTSTGDAALEGLVHAGAATAASAFFEPEADTTYDLPFEFKAGAAWIGQRAQVEVDVFAYSGRDPYRAIESEQPVFVVTDPGQGGTPSLTQVTYQGLTVDPKAVVNLAIGGRYQLTSSGKWTLHGGFATDGSPVGDADTGFTDVDLKHVTVGLSARTKLFLASLGLRYSTGRSDLLGLGPTASGGTFETTFKVSSVGVVYSLAVLF